MTDLTCPSQFQAASCMVYKLIYFIVIAVKIIILILILMEVDEMSQNKIDLFHINQQEQNLKRSLSVCM